MPDAPLPGLSAIADRYDAIICDVWGVLHDGLHAHPGVPEALTAFRRHGPVVLVTNAPRPSGPVVRQLESLGVPHAAFDGIVSSGDVVRSHLIAAGHRAVYHIGPMRDRPLYEGTAIKIVATPEDADVIVAAGMRDDDVDKPDDYRDELARCLATGTPFVCANPDIIVERGAGFVWCAGALARLYDEMGGHALQFGKPHPPIYEAALRIVTERAGDAPRVLAIGDGLPTDISGANAQGFDVLFITEGIHAADLGPPLQPDPEKVAARLAREGLRADYYMPRLAW
jgi:HAD superfamily hydrolase (TIGR01459 family)